MGFIRVTAWNQSNRQLEPMLVNTALIRQVRFFEIGKGVNSCLILADDEYKPIGETVDQVSKLLLEAVPFDPETEVMERCRKAICS